jgi:hypothetical protein
MLILKECWMLINISFLDYGVISHCVIDQSMISISDINIIIIGEWSQTKSSVFYIDFNVYLFVWYLQTKLHLVIVDTKSILISLQIPRYPSLPPPH